MVTGRTEREEPDRDDEQHTEAAEGAEDHGDELPGCRAAGSFSAPEGEASGDA
jgi:hypothetical protein